MLARPYRLTSSRDFAETIRRGRRAGTSTVVLHLVVASDPAGGPAGDPAGDRGLAPRVGLVVGKAVGNAVTRNQVKRRLRHAAHERLDRLPHGSRLVIRALPPAAERTSAVLGHELDASLRRLGVHA